MERRASPHTLSNPPTQGLRSTDTSRRAVGCIRACSYGGRQELILEEGWGDFHPFQRGCLGWQSTRRHQLLANRTREELWPKGAFFHPPPPPLWARPKPPPPPKRNFRFLLSSLHAHTEGSIEMSTHRHAHTPASTRGRSAGVGADWPHGAGPNHRGRNRPVACSRGWVIGQVASQNVCHGTLDVGAGRTPLHGALQRA